MSKITSKDSIIKVNGKKVNSMYGVGVGSYPVRRTLLDTAKIDFCVFASSLEKKK